MQNTSDNAYRRQERLVRDLAAGIRYGQEHGLQPINNRDLYAELDAAHATLLAMHAMRKPT